uniref:Uncharacterized protein n=1 Tax=Coccidioides posadasii RMSCC 3488 TaxID=454284 RepID=A0A0J6IK02_COCPO|nr:LOW QUALITY PROTEIN: hypothetical protein CPAG_08554 [Coccidioides posadasii RMSCC 3488]
MDMGNGSGPGTRVKFRKVATLIERMYVAIGGVLKNQEIASLQASIEHIKTTKWRKILSVNVRFMQFKYVLASGEDHATIVAKQQDNEVVEDEEEEVEKHSIIRFWQSSCCLVTTKPPNNLFDQGRVVLEHGKLILVVLATKVASEISSLTVRWSF